MKSIKYITIFLLMGAVLALGACAQAVTTSPATVPSVVAPTTTPAVTTPAPATAPPVITANPAPVNNQPAVEMSLARLQADYAADPVAAAAKYEGYRYIFRGVTAENISSLYKPVDNDLYVMNGDVKFRPRYQADLGPLKINSVMDIEGTVSWMQQGYVQVVGCTYTVTDTANAMDRPDYQFTF